MIFLMTVHLFQEPVQKIGDTEITEKRIDSLVKLLDKFDSICLSAKRNKLSTREVIKDLPKEQLEELRKLNIIKAYLRKDLNISNTRVLFELQELPSKYMTQKVYQEKGYTVYEEYSFVNKKEIDITEYIEVAK
jgi:hypothetical protein